ncbi:MAG: hydroxysqualene dehydroxylase HpnE [Planctomycetota bacterium]
MSSVSAKKRVVIVGAGLAGLAAAEALSRVAPQLEILILEGKRLAGGRAGSFQDRCSGDEIDYCQHVAMGCCTNWIDFVSRCGLQKYVRRDRELTFLHPKHPPSRFAANPWLPAPLHLLGTIAAQRYLSKSQQREIRRGLWRLMRTAEAELRTVTALEWLQAIGQSDETIRDFWEVILVSALGEKCERVAMSPARKVLIDGFAAAHGASDVLVPTRPLSELFGERVPKELRHRGVEFRYSSPVRQIDADGSVHTGEERIEPDHVICAVPWYRIGALFAGWHEKASVSLPNLTAWEQFSTSPISGVHLWYDRPIMERPHAVLVGTTAQWVFRDPIETNRNDREEYYFQVILSASAEVTTDREGLIETVQQELRHAFPLAREARLLRHRLVTDPKSVYSVSPDIDAARPETRTSIPWLKLAGDWVATGWPSTMESAVISGRLAATAVLEDLPSNPFPGNDRCLVLPGLPRGWLANRLIRS